MRRCVSVAYFACSLVLLGGVAGAQEVAEEAERLGPGKKLVALNIGHSIFDRSCSVDVGELCRNYGGGGHRGAGGCVLRPMAAGLAIKIVTEKLRKN